jgi:hypothetical protein
MGMYNAIVDDELLNPLGVYKERLSPVGARCRDAARDGRRSARGSELARRQGRHLRHGRRGLRLTDAQLHEQCKMYVAAVRIAHTFGCDAVGIQYQQGLKDMTPASDLVEGLLNNPDRPPVFHSETGSELYPGQAIPHFNEVDECAAVDALVTNRVATALGFDPSTTLHDLRWGEYYQSEAIDAYVWVFEISGAVPASHSWAATPGRAASGSHPCTSRSAAAPQGGE